VSIFKTKAIVLKINKTKDKNFIYTLFTVDYWKINCVKKLKTKEKSLDLWYNIDFQIFVWKKKDGIHTIRNIKILSEFNTQNKTFSEINTFLEFTALIFKKTPSWVPIPEIYNIFNRINSLETYKIEKVLLAKLKVLNVLWELNSNHKNKTVEKILKFVINNNIDTVLRLGWIENDILEELEKI